MELMPTIQRLFTVRNNMGNKERKIRELTKIQYFIYMLAVMFEVPVNLTLPR